jgi:hypothetical protein
MTAAKPSRGQAITSSPQVTHDNSMQRTALRAAADAAR